MPVVAVDAMGGDHAPAAVVAGALAACREGRLEVVLVGDRDRLAPHLAGGANPELVHTSEWVAMDEEPALALRRKKRASVRVAAELVAQQRADALVSAGSTGATVAAATLVLGRHPGIRRPAVGAPIPLDNGGAVLLVDAGGSADVQAEVLVTYARMGGAYAAVRGVDSPRVGLLNVGGEPSKGNALAREAHELLAAVAGFVGNVEPAEVLRGAVDVLVSDGFTGNVFLKTLEAQRLRSPLDAVDPGAAAILGVRGDVLVAHGDVDEVAFAAAVSTAAEVAGGHLAARIGRLLDGNGEEPA